MRRLRWQAILWQRLGRWLQGWADLARHQAADSLSGPAEPPETPQSPEKVTDGNSPDAAPGEAAGPPAHWLVKMRPAGPPAHWLAKVRAGAPHLLAGGQRTEDKGRRTDAATFSERPVERAVTTSNPAAPVEEVPAVRLVAEQQAAPIAPKAESQPSITEPPTTRQSEADNEVANEAIAQVGVATQIPSPPVFSPLVVNPRPLSNQPVPTAPRRRPTTALPLFPTPQRMAPVGPAARPQSRPGTATRERRRATEASSPSPIPPGPAAQTVAMPSQPPSPPAQATTPTPAAGAESRDAVRAEIKRNRQLPITNDQYPTPRRQQIEANKQTRGSSIRLSVAHPLPEGHAPTPRPEQSHGLKPVPGGESTLKRPIVEPDFGRLEIAKEGPQPPLQLPMTNDPLPLPADHWPTLPDPETAVPPDGEATSRERERRRRLECEQRGQVWNE